MSKKEIKLQEGDLFYFGLLNQVWLVKSVRNKLRAVIVSADSGWGWWDPLENVQKLIGIKNNGFDYIGNIKKSREDE